MTTENEIMLSGLIEQFCEAISSVVPAPFGDLVGQFCGLFAGLFESLGL
jgi:hypothetical protein